MFVFVFVSCDTFRKSSSSVNRTAGKFFFSFFFLYLHNWRLRHGGPETQRPAVTEELQRISRNMSGVMSYKILHYHYSIKKVIYKLWLLQPEQENNLGIGIFTANSL